MHVKIRKGCGWFAVIALVTYVTAKQVASSDGTSGVEISSEVSRAIFTLIIILSTFAVTGWISEQNIKAAADQEIRSVVAEEVTKALASHSARVAATARAVTIAECRTLLQQDVSEVIEAGLKRAERRGMVREATNRAAAMSDGPTVAIVSPIRRGVD